ncbi:MULTISPECIES: hypothetical protein [unclassified Pseudoalteromonas]|nr:MULTISPECIES: hypothetical protein [unclassified Pseudoalteromonas]
MSAKIDTISQQSIMSYYFDLAIEVYGCPAIKVINGQETIDITKKFN